MERAIRAQTIIKIFTATDPVTGKRVMVDNPEAEELPEWAFEACVAGKIFMTASDEYRYVWLETPYKTGGFDIYVVATPSCILMDRDGEVICLSMPDWKRLLSERY
jgi:hypothetical protein